VLCINDHTATTTTTTTTTTTNFETAENHFKKLTESKYAENIPNLAMFEFKVHHSPKIKGPFHQTLTGG